MHQIHKVLISANIVYATSNIKFPCYYSINWKTHDSNYSVDSQMYSAINGKAEINDSLSMSVDLSYQTNLQRYDRKQTQVQLNLISKTKVEAAKMVGRINVDLGAVVNEKLYKSAAELALQFCSVNAILKLSFSVISVQKLQMDNESIQRIIKSYQILDNNQISISNYPYNSNNSYNLNSSHHYNSNSNKKSSYFKEQQKAISLQNIPTGSPNIIHPHQPKPKIQISEINQPPYKYKQQQRQQQQKERAVKRLQLKEIAKQNEQNLQSLLDYTQNKSSIGRVGSLNSNFSNDLELRLIEEKFLFQQKLISDRNEQNKKQIEKLRQALSKAQEQNDQLKVQAYSQQKEIQKVKNQLSFKMQENINLTLNLAALKQQNNALHFKLSTFQIQLKNQMANNQQLKSYHRKWIEASRALDKAEYQLQKARESYAILECSQQQLKQSMRLVQQTNEKLAVQTQRAQAESQSAQQQSRLLRELCQELKTANNEQQQLIKELEEQKNNSVNVRTYYEEKSQQKLSFQAEILKLQNKNQVYQKQIFNLNHVNYQLQEAHEKGINKNNQLFAELEQCKQIKWQFSQKLMSLEQQKESLSQQVFSLRDQSKQLNKGLAQVMQQNSSLYNQCCQLRQRKLVQQSRVSQRQAQLNKTIFELQQLLINTNEQKNEKIVAYEKDLSRKDFQIQAKHRELQEMRRQIRQMGDKIAMCEQQIKSKYNIISKMQEGMNRQIQLSDSLNIQIRSHLKEQSIYKQKINSLQDQVKEILQSLEEQEVYQKRIIDQIATANHQNAQHQDLIQQQKCITEQYKNTLSKIRRQNQFSSATKDKQISVLQSLNRTLQQQLRLQQDRLTLLTGEVQAKTQHYEQSQLVLKNSLGLAATRMQQLQSRLGITVNLVNQLREVLKLKQTRLEQCLQHEQRLESSSKLQRQNISMLEEENIQKAAEIQEKTRMNAQYEGRVLQYEMKLSILKTQVETIKQSMKNQANETDKIIEETTIKPSRQNDQEVRWLRNRVSSLERQVSKGIALERALKIRQIQLRSLKSKIKPQGLQANQISQYMRMKDQEINQLKRFRMNDSSELARENKELKEKNQALSQEIELIQQEKFNFQTTINEQVFMIDRLEEHQAQLQQDLELAKSRAFELQFLLKENRGKGSQISSLATKNHYIQNLEGLSIGNLFSDLKTILDLRARTILPGDSFQFVAKSEEGADWWEGVYKMQRDFQRLKLCCLRGEAGQQDFKVKLVNEFKHAFKSIQKFKLMLKSYYKQ